MATNLADIEGIGPAYAKALANAGLKTTDDLLKVAGTAKGRKSLAEKSAVSEARILDWVNRADLMRIRGIGSEYSELLEASGVDTVKELATRAAGNLQAKMAQVNQDKKLVRRVPNIADIETWVSEAKMLSAMVSH